MMEIPIYNCLIEESDDTTGVYAISFVDCPANEVDFIALHSQADKLHLAKDSQKQVLTGAILKPDQLIYRQSPKLGEYYIKFSANQIEKIAQKMMRTGVALHNTTHQHQSQLNGNYLTELWIVTDPHTDKSKALGFKNLPKGTLMCSYKIEDANYWNNEVLTGNVKGFSLEGFFNQEIETKQAVKQLKKKSHKMNDNRKRQSLIGRIADVLLGIEDVQKSDSTASGNPYIVFALANGQEVLIDEDGYATLDGEQLAGGEHKLADGNILEVDEQGQFVETRKASDKTTKTEDAKAPQNLRRRRHRLEQFDPKTASALKAKISEMQTTIDQLSDALVDAQGLLENTKSEVEEMRMKTPSAQPMRQKLNPTNGKDMTTSERMAMALSQTMSLRK